MVDHVCLTENGLSLIKELTLDAPSTLTPAQKAAHAARQARLRLNKVKQSHPQMSQLLCGSTSVTGQYFDSFT